MLDVPLFPNPVTCHLLAGSFPEVLENTGHLSVLGRPGEGGSPQRGLPREADLSIVVPQRGTKLEGLLRGRI